MVGEEYGVGSTEYEEGESEKGKVKRGLLDWLLLVGFVGALGVAAFGLFQFFFQPTTLVLTWSTENEIDILGFNVYRGESADGEFVKINSAPIPASQDPILGQNYNFEDGSAERGQTYYYQLETLFRDGEVERSEQTIILPPP